MNAIRLQSFRSLADTGFVDLRPLTILVGKNSSGKSTFLRFLPLLRQSVEARTTGPIHWFGDYVDFGGFEETASRLSTSKQIRVGLRMSLDGQAVFRRLLGAGHSYYYARRRAAYSRVPCDLELTIAPDPRDNSVARFRSIGLKAAGHTVHIDIEGVERVTRLVINDRDPFGEGYSELRLRPGALLPILQRRSSAGSADAKHRRHLYGRAFALEELMAQLDPMFHGNTKWQTRYSVARQLSFGSDDEILSLLRSIRWPGKSWTRSVRRLHPKTKAFRDIREWNVANAIGAVVDELDAELWRIAKGVRYSKPVRAAAERYYRQQGLAGDEVDPAGSNLAMFLRGLTGAQKRDFEEWTFRELGWRIVPRLAGGHVSLRIETSKGMGYNLADVGFGFSQMLPVLMQIWSIQRGIRLGRRERRAPVTLAIEQPELHLHPSLQAKLADIVVASVAASRRDGGDLRVLLETHSEAIVGRVGEWVTGGDIDADDVAVVLFDPVADGLSEVKVSSFDSQGFLTDWPFGFFDPD